VKSLTDIANRPSIRQQIDFFDKECKLRRASRLMHFSDTGFNFGDGPTGDCDYFVVDRAKGRVPDCKPVKYRIVQVENDSVDNLA
jgi:hypothetical protein